MSSRKTLSFSALSTLLKDPAEYKEKYIDKEFQYEQKQLVEGGLFHCLLLEPEKFDEKFVVQAQKLPPAGAKNFCDWYYKTKWLEEHGPVNLATLEDIILEWLSDQNLYDKMSPKVKISKIVTPEAQEYIDTLITAQLQKKSIVTFDSVRNMTDKVNAIKKYDNDHDHFLFEDAHTIIGRNEMDLTISTPEYMFDLRGIIDRVKINYETTTVDVIDYKKTANDLTRWKDGSFHTYNYKLQMPIYEKLIKSLIKEDSTVEWKFRYWFVVVSDDLKVYPFQVSEESMIQWRKELDDACRIAEYHLSTNQFDLPKDYLERKVVL